MTEEATQKQLRGLSALLQIEKETRHAGNLQDLAFLIVNDTRRLVEYDQAILFQHKGNNICKLHSVSGVAQIEKNAPFVDWTTKVVNFRLKKNNSSEVSIINPDELPGSYKDNWSEWVTGNALWCPVKSMNGELLGVLWLSKNGAWHENEIAIIERVSDAYAHAWAAIINARPRKIKLREWATNKKSRLGVILFVIVIMFLPVRQTVLAPAEIVPYNPYILTSPLDGVIKKIYIDPSQAVKHGDHLLSFDDTTIRNQYEITLKSLDVSRAKLLQATQKSFRDERSKEEVSLLKAEVDQKSAEVSYSNELLKRTRVYAARGGVAIFTGRDDWEGKPVVVGEKIMVIAKPGKSDLKIWLPVDDAIQLDSEQEVHFFLNIDPTRTIKAKISQTSYEAQPSLDGKLSFVLRAKWSNDAGPSHRIGLKGTAKIYGKTVSLFYYLFRKPISALRQRLGF
ncbi:MAG TPA: HlyD family efflux transporter periplasmic adaptor subunit [Gammaproteobacteria bacterium]|nr:HlyD family efflux transporter periplasmic adaptor subunit [Gammaproteobacteria bacterium]